MGKINATEIEIEQWADASPLFARDEFNVSRLHQIAEHLEKKLGRQPFLAEVAAIVNQQPDAFHWLADPNEQRQAQRQTQPEIRGTSEQKLYALGVPVSGRQSHADKVRQDAALVKRLADARSQVVKIRSEGERKQAIRDAEQHREYYSDGRINWGKTNDVRAQKLAALGIVQS